MVHTTRAQREALFKVFQRDFPSWVSPGRRRSVREITRTLPVPTLQWRRFRARVVPGPGCIMVSWARMWLVIEPDGYTHSWPFECDR